MGYTHCPCCGIDAMDGDFCAYCEEACCTKTEQFCDGVEEVMIDLPRLDEVTRIAKHVRDEEPLKPSEAKVLLDLFNKYADAHWSGCRHNVGLIEPNQDTCAGCHQWLAIKKVMVK